MNIFSIFGPTINYSEPPSSSENNVNPINFLSSLFSREFMDLFQENSSSTNTTPPTNTNETENTSTQTTSNIEEVIFYYNDIQPSSTQNGIPLNEMRNISTLETCENENEEVCVICHQPILNQQIFRKLNHCSHKFHIHCIDEWLTSNRTCPTCRTELYENRQETTETSARTSLPLYQFRYGRR